ncbi:DNA-directed RNA polymerase subunit A'' [Halocatena salina]|uniref:DNA-directed RNA polymerase subunit Rpo1C n=1 Tax=Halocatena salina TaxID=2934340 RepID=A0A8U0A817_9EURY|nr:DNA-directed RNA polymerase subunit A'' [Halocatena salina]UPM44057.1 DNA-directed RNA polymerase subunit A'' [Halocatena salina]
MAVSDDIELVVEDTELPRRLKDKVYSVINEKGVTDIEAADQIARRVEREYVDTRVDPLDPVGTVSAQSIGEPGTQMSVPHDERILLRRDGETEATEIGPLVDSLMESRETRAFDDHEVALAPDDLEVLSLGRDEQVQWKPVEEVSRHKTPDELLRFTLESGRTVRATKAHSFVTREDNEIVPVNGSDLEAGDWLPVVGEFSVEDGTESTDLREYLPPDEYWYTSSLTDGGTETAVPAGPDQIRNKRKALTAGEIEERAVYPVQGTVGFPERFSLDEETGFFVGALLAEGNVTDYYVSVSNVDPAFQERIRSFAHRFGLSVNEYKNKSGFTDGYDIRVNGKVLADFIRSACFEDDNKIVPDFAFGASEEFVGGLLNGYFSGDGNVSASAIRASSTSEQLIEGIALLLARVGVYATRSSQEKSHTLRIPNKFVPHFAEQSGMIGERGEQLSELAAEVDSAGPDTTDQIPNFGDVIESVAKAGNIPQRQFNSATKRQRIGRNRLARLVSRIEDEVDSTPEELDVLRKAVEGDVVWDRIESIERIESEHEHVYDVSVAGLETFTTGQGVVTHNTMNTFHYAGVAEIDVTQGLPRLIELVDARKTPDTPTMTVHLEDEYADNREKAHEVVWKIEATRILALGDVSTNVADMLVRIDLNEETLHERWPTVESLDIIVTEIADTIESELGVETYHQGTMIEFGPDEPSYRDLLQLVEELRDIVFKGIGDISRVVIRKEDRDDRDGQEFVLYTEGAAFKKVLEIEGVDASRTTTNNIHEVYRVLGVEAARERIIEETMDTLEEQGLGDVNIRHLMLVADIMTNRGTIESIGRHGISGNKESVLARAAFEVTVNHLLDAAVHGESDELDGVTENVIVGKPIKLGTGDVTLRMGSTATDE